MKKSYIAVFDSGVGGLHILESLVKEYKNENFIYLADEDFFPYGVKTKEQLENSGIDEIEESMSAIPCPVCKGKRLKPEVLAVTVGGINIAEYCDMSVVKALEFMENLELTGQKAQIAEVILKEIKDGNKQAKKTDKRKTKEGKEGAAGGVFGKSGGDKFLQRDIMVAIDRSTYEGDMVEEFERLRWTEEFKNRLPSLQ